jgi:hypothetical protein
LQPKSANYGNNISGAGRQADSFAGFIGRKQKKCRAPASAASGDLLTNSPDYLKGGNFGDIVSGLPYCKFNRG